MEPAQSRVLDDQLRTGYRVSERRACAVLTEWQTIYRYQGIARAEEQLIQKPPAILISVQIVMWVGTRGGFGAPLNSRIGRVWWGSYAVFQTVAAISTVFASIAWQLYQARK